MRKPLFRAEKLRPSGSNIKVYGPVLSDMYQELFLLSVFQMKTSSFYKTAGELKLAQPPTPTPYSWRENKKCPLLKGFVKYYILQKILQLIHLCICIWQKKTQILSLRGLRTIIIRNSLYSFFIRTRNFCLRLDAQNVDIHPRLGLLLYFLPS